MKIYITEEVNNNVELWTFDEEDVSPLNLLLSMEDSIRHYDNAAAGDCRLESHLFNGVKYIDIYYKDELIAFLYNGFPAIVMLNTNNNEQYDLVLKLSEFLWEERITSCEKPVHVDDDTLYFIKCYISNSEFFYFVSKDKDNLKKIIKNCPKYMQAIKAFAYLTFHTKETISDGYTVEEASNIMRSFEELEKENNIARLYIYYGKDAIVLPHNLILVKNSKNGILPGAYEINLIDEVNKDAIM